MTRGAFGSRLRAAEGGGGAGGGFGRRRTGRPGRQDGPSQPPVKRSRTDDPAPPARLLPSARATKQTPTAVRRSDAHADHQAHSAQTVVSADGTQLILATNLVATTANAPSFAAILARRTAGACRRPCWPMRATPAAKRSRRLRRAASRRWSPPVAPNAPNPRFPTTAGAEAELGAADHRPLAHPHAGHAGHLQKPLTLMPVG